MPKAAQKISPPRHPPGTRKSHPSPWRDRHTAPDRAGSRDTDRKGKRDRDRQLKTGSIRTRISPRIRKGIRAREASGFGGAHGSESAAVLAGEAKTKPAAKRKNLSGLKPPIISYWLRSAQVRAGWCYFPRSFPNGRLRHKGYACSRY